MQNDLHHLEAETSEYKGYDEEELEVLLGTSCKPEADRRRHNVLSAIGEWRTCLDAEAGDWERVCDILGVFIKKLCCLHLEHRVGSENKKSGERFTDLAQHHNSQLCGIGRTL